MTLSLLFGMVSLVKGHLVSRSLTNPPGSLLFYYCKRAGSSPTGSSRLSPLGLLCNPYKGVTESYSYKTPIHLYKRCKPN